MRRAEDEEPTFQGKATSKNIKTRDGEVEIL